MSCQGGKNEKSALYDRAQGGSSDCGTMLEVVDTQVYALRPVS